MKNLIDNKKNETNSIDIKNTIDPKNEKNILIIKDPKLKDFTIPKLIIPKKVSDKIIYLCGIIHHTEWSGVLFYSYTGDFGKDMIITVEDVLLKDIGNTAFTAYDFDADIAGYMLNNNLKSCKLGHIHSHHSMETFFSGTDMDTVKTEGADNVHFVSLIVNNKGVYTSMITNKSEDEITTVQKIKSSVFSFGNKKNEVLSTIDSTTNRTTVFAFKMDVITENSEYLETIQLIKDFQEAEKLKRKNNISLGNYQHYSGLFPDYPDDDTIFYNANKGNNPIMLPGYTPTPNVNTTKVNSVNDKYIKDMWEVYYGDEISCIYEDRISIKTSEKTSSLQNMVNKCVAMLTIIEEKLPTSTNNLFSLSKKSLKTRQCAYKEIKEDLLEQISDNIINIFIEIDNFLSMHNVGPEVFVFIKKDNTLRPLAEIEPIFKQKIYEILCGVVVSQFIRLMERNNCARVLDTRALIMLRNALENN